MSTVVNFSNHKFQDVNIAGKKSGEITVSVFEGEDKSNPCFVISSTSDKVLPVSYVIEDTLCNY